MEEKIKQLIAEFDEGNMPLDELETKLLILYIVSNRRKLLIATIEKVRYNLDGYGALTSSEIAERLEKAINCC